MKPQGSLATLSISAVDSQIRRPHHDSHLKDDCSPKDLGRKASENERQRSSAPPARPNVVMNDNPKFGQSAQLSATLRLQSRGVPEGSKVVAGQRGPPEITSSKPYNSVTSSRSADIQGQGTLESNDRKRGSQLAVSSDQGQRPRPPPTDHSPGLPLFSGSSTSDSMNRGVKRGNESPALYPEASAKRPKLDRDTVDGRIKPPSELVPEKSSNHHDGIGSGASRQRTLTMMDQNLARRKSGLSSSQSNDPETHKGLHQTSVVKERSAESSEHSQVGHQQIVATLTSDGRQHVRAHDLASTRPSPEDDGISVPAASVSQVPSDKLDRASRMPFTVSAPSDVIALSIEESSAPAHPTVSPDANCGALGSDELKVILPQDGHKFLRSPHPGGPHEAQLRSGLSSGTNDAVSSSAHDGTRLETSIRQSLPHGPTASHLIYISDKVRTALDKCIRDCASETEYWNRISLARARRTIHVAQSQTKSLGETDEPVSFARLTPLDLTPRSSGKDGPVMQLRVENNTLTRTVKSKWTVPCSMYSTQEVSNQVPEWAHYVSLEANILSYNTTTLQSLPYFGDEFDMADELGQDLKLLYNMDFEGREDKVKRLLQAERLEEFVDEALASIGCDWESVLQVFLDPNPDVGLDLEARSAVARRKEWYNEAVLKGEERVSVVLSRLPPSDHRKNAIAAVFCKHFQDVTGFTLWQIARRHDLVKPPSKQLDEDEDDRVCRICRTGYCTEHGEMREYDDEASDRGYDSATGEEHALSTDIVHPLNVNFRIRSKFTQRKQEDVQQIKDRDDMDIRKRDPRRLEYWMDTDKYERMVELRKAFYPCYHPDQTCEEAQCSCARQKVMCEKSCGCAQSCPRRFKGCACKTNDGRSVCFQDDRCVCFALWRECDPDLCGGCGVSDILAPGNRHDDTLLAGRCANAGLQRGRPRHTILGESSVHGLGLYACEDINAHEFVGEYRGEIITKQEAERRGVLQKILDLSYLFNINADQEVDATYMGNKTRFINHLKYGKANLVARIALVGTVHRIALFADKAIKAGDELFFDYGPEFPEHNLGGKAPAKSAPRARNTRDVASFYDAEVEEDEAGNRRVKKTTRGRPRKDNGKQSRSKAESKAGVRTGRARKVTSKRAPSRKPRPRRHVEESEGENSEAGGTRAYRATGSGPQQTTELRTVIQDSVIEEITSILEMDDHADMDFRPEFDARDTSSGSDEETANSGGATCRRVARKTVRGLRGPTARTQHRNRDGETEELR